VSSFAAVTSQATPRPDLPSKVGPCRSFLSAAIVARQHGSRSLTSDAPGRPSKALTLAQAEAVLTAAEGTRMHAYIVVSLLTGARPPRGTARPDLGSCPP
jgi:hypothetical protein